MSLWSLLSVRLLLCLICALGASPTVAQHTDDKQCSPLDGSSSTCQCQTDDGKKIDLTPLDRAKTDGKPKFTGLTDQGGTDYEYNPCSKFTEGEKCQNVFLCQSKAGQSLFIAANDHEQIYKESSSGKYYVHYTGPAERFTKVYLNCNQCIRDGSILSNAVNQSVPSHYVLQLESCHACPGGCDPSKCGSKGPAPGYIGIVLIIVIFFSLIAYFIIGAVLLKFHYQASGTDIIPNKTLWVQFPLLVKDGCVFTFGPCFKFIAEKVKRRNDYQNI